MVRNKLGNFGVASANPLSSLPTRLPVGTFSIYNFSYRYVVDCAYVASPSDGRIGAELTRIVSLFIRKN